MIKKVTYYDIICDRCGKSLTKESEMCYPDIESAEMVAMDSEWKKNGGKHYCAECYKLDEDTDEYVPKKGGEKMKKYIVKYKEGGKVFGEYLSKEEAAKKLTEYIHISNMCEGFEYTSSSDFVLEEVECREVNEVITDFETARKVLGIKPLEGIIVSKRLEGVERLVREINPKHIEALIALNELFTIAQAWNKEDGFVPDFSDWNQNKWYPWFKYDKDAAVFVFANTNHTPTGANAYFGSRLCFKTRERAEQFGKQFIELYNKVFL